MDVMEERDVYLSDFGRFERELGIEAYSDLQRRRNEAIARFAELGFRNRLVRTHQQGRQQAPLSGGRYRDRLTGTLDGQRADQAERYIGHGPPLSADGRK